MKIIALEEKSNFLKVIEKNVKQFTYVDKFNKPIYVRYKLANGETIDFDLKRKKEKKNLNSPLIYNIYNVLNAKNSRRHRTIVIAKDEETSDFINKKSRTLVATTLLNGINGELTEKMLQLFNGLDIILLVDKDKQYEELKNNLSKFANSIKQLNVNDKDNELLSKEEKRIIKILNH